MAGEPCWTGVRRPPSDTELQRGGLRGEMGEVNRYFYYKVSKPQERTWYKPLPQLEPDPDDHQDHRRFVTIGLQLCHIRAT